REGKSAPVPLSSLSEHLGFSAVSIHEMVQKLEGQQLVNYQRYRGVMLTAEGERLAQAVVRRHRIWERFLTDMLDFPWDEAHILAERLEHAAPQEVTDRLAALLGNPEECPHGGPIPPQPNTQRGQLLSQLPPGAIGSVIRIRPELPELLQELHALGIAPHAQLRIVAQMPQETVVQRDRQEIRLPAALAGTLWLRVDV
ncbi:MAG TPA: metal-dependent transcriptional regulator, partial [Chloroflexi bacterium]|nr:metal-dependent transcriptional regulator [Chloroflexota bacterium]